MSGASLYLAICSRRIVTPEGVREGAVLIDSGVIRDVIAYGQIPSDCAIDDVGDLVVMPGLVDTHVHINEPGRTEWEGFEAATKAAAAGGITTLVDMPLNSSPVTTTLSALRSKLAAAEGKLWVDCGFYGGVIPGNAAHLQSLIDAGVLGFKAFLIHSGIDEFPNAGEPHLRAAMPILAKAGLPLLVHCELTKENPKSSTGRVVDQISEPKAHPPLAENPKSYFDYLFSRPRKWEHDAIDLMIRLCKEYNCCTHIVHLSSTDAIPMLKQARDNGLPLTVETCPHYVYFVAEEIPDGDTRFKCAPPIRERENRDRLWDGLKDGVIDFVVSDHSPCPPEMKRLDDGDFMKAWGGIASLQFGLSVVCTEAKKHGFTIEDVARWMCQIPVQLVGLANKKGAIAPGYDGDLVVWNPDALFVVEQSMILHRHKVTPYEGKTLLGVVEKTYLRGRKIYEKGKVVVKPSGTVLLRTSSEGT